MLKDRISEYLIPTPDPMEYYVSIETEKMKKSFIDRVEKLVRSSMEYRDYINFLKNYMDMNRCWFFQKVCQEKTNGRKRISIEIHHAPFTLYDIVSTVIDRFQEEGRPLNALLIADEVMELHYANKVGLIPLSKTMHQVVHNSSKIKIPLYATYGNYTEILDEYDETNYSEILYDKLEREIEITKGLKPEDFDAISTEFTYINVPGYDEIEKLEVQKKEIV